MRERNYWTKERCLEESSKYESRKDFQKNSKSCYNTAYKNKWLDDVCKHMVSKNKCKGFWNFENCKVEASKFNTINEFQKGSRGAYHACRKNDWLYIFYAKVDKHETGYWTKDKCLEEVSRFETRSDFRLNSKAYSVSVVNNWLDEICFDKPGHKPKGYWTKERCLEAALKYETRVDFEKGSISACVTSRKNGWIDEVCSHMRPLGNSYKRCIYAIEFSDNYVYVGLTYNLIRRFNSHISNKKNNKSSVYKHILKTGIVPTIRQLTEYIDIKDASVLEGIKLEEYIKNGWKTLNRSKCGALGGSKLFWIKERVIEEAGKYLTKEDFRKNSSGAWASAQRNGWLMDLIF
jgi:hypothetical protein